MITNIPILTTKRCRLRSFTDKDLQNVYSGLSHPEVIKYYGISFSTLEDTKEQMKWFHDLEKNKEGRWWAIESVFDQTFYGAGGYNDWNHEHNKAEIGFWLLPKFWGKGLMQEVFPVIVEEGHKKMGMKRIEGFVDSNNINCKNALSKVNFDYEGTMRNCEKKGDEYISLDIYASIV